MDEELNEEATTETEFTDNESTESGSKIGAGIIGAGIALALTGLVSLGRKLRKKHKEKKYVNVPRKDADDEYYDEEE